MRSIFRTSPEEEAVPVPERAQVESAHAASFEEPDAERAVLQVTEETKGLPYWRDKHEQWRKAKALRNELRKEKDKYYLLQQRRVWKWEDFEEQYRDGAFRKDAVIEPGRPFWKFWRPAEQPYLDVVPPPGAGREGAPPLVIMGGLGSGLESYLDSIYEAATAGRRVIFMNPSRNFRARREDMRRVAELERVTNGKGRIPKPLVRKASVAARILEELGVERFDLIGHSQGGIVASALTAIERDRVRVLELASAGGLMGDDSFLPLAIRFGHEIAHRSLSSKMPRLYSKLESLLIRTGAMESLYRKLLLPALDENEREELLAMLEEQREAMEQGRSFGKKVQKLQKAHGIGNLVRWPGLARAAGAIAASRVGEILAYQQRAEGLQTRIYAKVAHGELTFPAHMLTKRIQELGGDFSLYTIDDGLADHQLEGFAMRNTLQILELEDAKDAEQVTTSREAVAA